MARNQTRTASKPSAKSRDQIIVEAAGDPALAAKPLAELAQEHVQPRYLNHPGLKNYADAWRHTEATDNSQPGYEEEVASRCDRADEAADDLFDTPAQTVDDVIAKFAAFIARYGGGRTEPDSPDIFTNPVGIMLDGGDLLPELVGELIKITRPPEPDGAAVELERRLDAVIPRIKDAAKRGLPLAGSKAHAEFDAIYKAAFASEATTPAMLRVKARIADFWMGWIIDDLEMEDLSVRLAAGVVKGVLASPHHADSDWEPTTWAREAWNAALAKYEVAVAAREPLAAQSEAAFAAAMAKAPPELVAPSIHSGVHNRWNSLAALDRDPTIPLHEKQRLRPAVEAWLTEFKATAFSTPEEDAKDEAAYDVISDAERELLATPAPDVAALALQSTIFFRETDDDKLGADDLGRVAFMRTGYYDQRFQVVMHEGILRLAGVDHPMLRMERFDPRAWITEFEAAGGKVSCFDSKLLFVPGAETGPMLDALLACDWKVRAVYLRAEHRMDEGGDPIVDAYGESGHLDSRRRGTAFFGHVEEGTLVMFGRNPDGTPKPHVRRFDNRPQTPAEPAARQKTLTHAAE